MGNHLGKRQKNVHYICLNEFGNIVDEKGFNPSINVKELIMRCTNENC